MTSTEANSNDGFKFPNFKPQKTITYNKLLPYSGVLAEEAVYELKEIKENLAKAVILRDMRPGCLHWVACLSRYMKLFGMYFSKEDHIRLVKLVYEVVINPDQEFWVTSKFCQVLSSLLKKRELLTPEDLTLPWKPLADLYRKLFHSSYKSMGMIPLSPNAEIVLKNAIRSCRPYFSPNASFEIIEEIRPQFCPYDSQMFKAMAFLELFLPTMFMPNSPDPGYKAWFDELMRFFTSFHNEPMWIGSLFSLLARLAWHNIGYIDWEPHIPLLFTRILSQFHLPVLYKKVSLYSKRTMEIWPLALFVVSNLGGGSRTQVELDRLFKILESYFHPSNSGFWTRNLNEFQLKLSHYFVQRIHNERYRKPSWVTNVTEEKKLTEDDITAFVKCLQPAASLSVFSKTGSYEGGVVLHRLSLLRPEIIIPPLLDQLYSAMDTMTEPHRLIASLQCVVGVARPLVLGGKKVPSNEMTYPEGPSHIVPLLFQVLPGIDPNDVNKCMVTFQFISTFVSLVPLIDCSAADEEISNLTEMEQQICMQTAEFANFVLQFIGKAFNLVESLALDQSSSAEREKEAMNFEENMVEIGLSSTFKTILTQSHPKIFDIALDALLSYTKGRCLEAKVAGKFIATMWRSAAKVNPDKTLTTFLPTVCRVILSLTENSDHDSDENVDEELLFNMLLLSELVQSKGMVLVNFIPKIIEVLQSTIHLKCRKEYRMSCSILRNLLWSLNLTVPYEVRSSIYPWDTPFSVYFPIRHWGEAGNIDNLNLRLVEPGEEEEIALKTLVRTFLTPEIRLINSYVAGDSSIDRDRLHQSLCIIQDILYAGASLPMWNEKHIELVEMAVKKNHSSLKLRSHCLEVTLDAEELPSNVRMAVAGAILSLVEFLLAKESDDTKSLNYASSIYLNISLFYGVKREEFDTRWKSFERVKQSLSDSVVKRKQHIRALLIERTVLQYEMRILDSNFNSIFTETHRKILGSLVQLATSHYSSVRMKSQAVLNQFFRRFPYSYRLALPSIIETLQKDPVENHKELKGALYVVLGYKEKTLVVRRDWQILSQLLPKIVATSHSENLSIIKLFDTIMRAFFRHFELFAIKLQVSEGVVAAALELLKSKRPAVQDPLVTTETELRYVAKLQAKSEANLRHYNSLIEELSSLVQSDSLHWRKTQICLYFLGGLIRPDVKFPSVGVEAFLSQLNSDNIVLRKCVLGFLPPILKSQKPVHKKIFIDSPFKSGDNLSNLLQYSPGDNRCDNRWMQYNKDSLALTEEQWNSKTFVHKTWKGWYCWPSKKLEVYAPPKDQPCVKRSYNDLPKEEQVIYDFFSRSDNVEKLIKFLSLEEHKGRDKFDHRKFLFFKGLFRNFGDDFLPILKPHLEKLVGESQESSQRCAAEIIAGMVRGTKHWTFHSSQKVLSTVSEFLDVVFSKVMNESLEDWGTCLSHISMDRDPNKFAPIIETMLKDMVPQCEGSFLISSRLYLCQVFLEQQEWRISEPYHRIMGIFESHLSNPYKSIRDRVGLFLSRILFRDEPIPYWNKTLSPHHADFIEAILPQLACLIQESGNGEYFPTIPSSLPHGTHIGPEGPVSMAMLPLSLPIGSVGQSLLREHEPASRPDSPKDSQESPPRESSLGGLIDIKKDGICHSPNTLSQSVSFGTPNNLYEHPPDNEERKMAIRLMNTVCRYLTFTASHVNSVFPPELYQFLPHLCHLESVDTDLELRNNCVNALACMSRLVVSVDEIHIPINTLKSICQGGGWRARMAALSFLQVFIFNNMFNILETESAELAQQMVLDALGDARAEVRQMASQVLSGLFHSNFLPAEAKILDDFTKKLNRSKRQREASTGRLLAMDTKMVTERHCGALGLCAFISAYPYDVPPYMPKALITLSEHVNDPQPISTDVKQALSHFKRTHHDNWIDHKKKFTSEQLSVLTDVLVSPSYYA